MLLIPPTLLRHCFATPRYAAAAIARFARCLLLYVYVTRARYAADYVDIDADAADAMLTRYQRA